MIALFGDLNNFDNAEEIYGTAVERGLMPAEVKEDQMKTFSLLLYGYTRSNEKIRY